MARADVGSTLRVAVTATNSGGSTNATSAATAAVSEASAPAPAPAPANLAPNPGFESDPRAAYYTWGPGKFSWAIDAAHGGSRSVKIVGTTPGALGRWLSLTDKIGATSGRTYTASAWLKASGVTENAQLVINFWNGSTHLGTYGSPTITGTTGWTKLNVSGIAPAGTTHVRIESRLSGPGTLWTDDAELATSARDHRARRARRGSTDSCHRKVVLGRVGGGLT